MKISVIIPAYNEEILLGKCLESVQKQTISPAEIIVVDNNSTDKTAAIARSFGVKVITEKRQGVIFARTCGFNEAKYDIIVRTDADCSLPPNYLENLDEIYLKQPTIAACGGIILYEHLPVRIFALMNMYKLRLIFGYYCMIAGSMSLKTEAWTKIKQTMCLRNDINEDIDVSVHLNQFGLKVHFDPSLYMFTSPRRLFADPYTQFVTYTKQDLFTHRLHKQLFKKT